MTTIAPLVYLGHLMHYAGGERGEALDVYAGSGEQDPPVQVHLCLSGHVVDVPWTAVVAQACGHSSVKGCLRYFQLGVTCNSMGESLGCVHCLGYMRDSDTQILRVDTDIDPGQPGHVTWEEGKVCYSVQRDGAIVFNEEAARPIWVSED
jgi:hypothetical protein